MVTARLPQTIWPNATGRVVPGTKNRLRYAASLRRDRPAGCGRRRTAPIIACHSDFVLSASPMRFSVMAP